MVCFRFELKGSWYCQLLHPSEIEAQAVLKRSHAVALRMGNRFLRLTPVRENGLSFGLITRDGEPKQTGVKAQIGLPEIFFVAGGLKADVFGD
jgi:hypothetical protein